MATTHVFIVDVTTFKLHLEYMFAGTGAGNNYIDFNSVPNSSLHSTTENNLLGMIADFQRVRIGDYVIFYLQQNFSLGIREGKFYGVFKVTSNPFLDNNDAHQYLKNSLGKSLTFRVLIEPYQVYAQGVTEWEALDEIRNIQSPNQMLWSLIYRKLKGNRGNTMITIYESERLISLIRNKNNRVTLSGSNFSFNQNNQEIVVGNQTNQYIGRQVSINILPRMVNKCCRGLQFETHLQAYILQNLQNLPMFSSDNIEWIGNEVSCGVGMQRIDITLSVGNENRKVMPIELKSTCVYQGITNQLQRYVDWIEQYYLPNRPSDIEPMIISREVIDKTTTSYQNIITEFRKFNTKNSILPLRYVEFSIDCDNENINFTEILY